MTSVVRITCLETLVVQTTLNLVMFPEVPRIVEFPAICVKPGRIENLQPSTETTPENTPATCRSDLFNQTQRVSTVTAITIGAL